MPNVLIVNSIGPQGPVGPQGPTGPSGSVSTGSFVTTSSFNAFTGSYNTGSFTGSFIGNGVGLYNIPASGITGLNLSQIASGSYSASISPANGFTVNTNESININGTSIVALNLYNSAGEIRERIQVDNSGTNPTSGTSIWQKDYIIRYNGSVQTQNGQYRENISYNGNGIDRRGRYVSGVAYNSGYGGSQLLMTQTPAGMGQQKITAIGYNVSSYIDDNFTSSVSYAMHAQTIINGGNGSLHTLSIDREGATQHIFLSNGNVVFGGYTDYGYKLDVNGTGRFTSDVQITGSLTVQTLGNTTQITSVVQAGTGSLALVPQGGGSIVASIPDGTATGGNARGTYNVDLQILRNLANQVIWSSFSGILSGRSNRISNSGLNAGAGDYSVIAGGRLNVIDNTTAGGSNFIGGGDSNIIQNSDSYAVIGGGLSNGVTAGSGYSKWVIGGGDSNNITANFGFIGGGASNTISGGAVANYSTISGGQSNTASTNTHATVVGGQSNTASGAQSIAGGLSSVASGANSVALGYKATATATGAIVIAANDGAGTPQASGNWSMVLGGVMSTATTSYATTLGGYRNTASGFASYALGYRSEAYLRGQLSIGEYFVTTGDAQQSLLTARNSGVLSTGGTLVLYLDGSSATSTLIPNGTNRVWHTIVDTVAVVTTISGSATGVTVGDSFMQTDKLLFKKIGGTSSVVGRSTTETIYDTSMSTAAMLFATGSLQELAITFQAPTFSGGGSITCRVVSKVSLVEVAY